MEGNTLKTLAEYIVQLNNNKQRLENPEEYQDREADTNGVEQDYVETFWPPDERWAHLHPTLLHLGAPGLVAHTLPRSMKIETSKGRHRI